MLKVFKHHSAIGLEYILSERLCSSFGFIALWAGGAVESVNLSVPGDVCTFLTTSTCSHVVSRTAFILAGWNLFRPVQSGSDLRGAIMCKATRCTFRGRVSTIAYSV